MKDYMVKSCSIPITIDSDWNIPAWQNVESLKVALHHRPAQWEHSPSTEVKLQYNSENLYVIFRMQDRHGKAMATDIPNEVWMESCVEFFFSPYQNQIVGDPYLNLEAKCYGLPLMQQHTEDREPSEPGLISVLKIGFQSNYSAVFIISKKNKFSVKT